MAKRGPKNLLDLTRESGNVRRALRSNRGLNHELKITFQHIASEQFLNDIGWRNQERLVRRHAVQVLGPYQKVIARMRVEREQKEMLAASAKNRTREASILLPPLTRPRTASTGTDRNYTNSAGDNHSGSGSFDDLTINFRSHQSPQFGRSRSPGFSSLTAAMTSAREAAASPYSRDAKKTQQMRAKTSLPRDGNFVSILQEKLDRFHLCLLEDTQSANRAVSPEPGRRAVDRQGDFGDEETIDAARLARLRKDLIHSVHGARLRTSARTRRQEASGLAGPTWQALAAAMHYTPRPATTAAVKQKQKEKTQQNNRVVTFAKPLKRPATIMEVPSKESGRVRSTAPTPITRNATIH